MNIVLTVNSLQHALLSGGLHDFEHYYVRNIIHLEITYNCFSKLKEIGNTYWTQIFFFPLPHPKYQC
jgi:hypothetical protein